MTILLSTTYLGPIQYYSKLILGEKVILERFEHYPKQTYRNRCIIYGANGPQTLTIPTTKGQKLKVYTKDIQIDNASNWPKIHFKAIESAYRCSPFYLYYIDSFLPFYNKKYTFLYDYNLEIIITLCDLMGVRPVIEESSDYTFQTSPSELDLRNCIHPKRRMFKPDPQFIPPVYQQVFEPKLGFIHNLSIIDLIFNTGPDALNLLQESIKNYKRKEPVEH
jgi:hypothetical protein